MAKTLALLAALLGLNSADAQSTPPIDSDVIVVLSGSGGQSKTFTYEDGSGRVDNVTVQINANLTFHVSSPQASGSFFTSTAADFDELMDINATATESEPGLSQTYNLGNNINDNYLGFPVETEFFGPQFTLGNGTSLSGNAASLSVSIFNPENVSPQNPEPYQLFYDGTNQVLTVWVRLPGPFIYPPYPADYEAWQIPCTATVTGNGSSFSGTVEDASTAKPIPNATVIIGGQTLTTDSTGKFFAPYLAPGSLAIQISAPGYLSYQKTEPLPPFSNLAVTFQLRPLPAITFYHQPGDANNGAGHAFLSLTWKDGTTRFYGFYAVNLKNLFLGAQGIILGGEPNWDYSISYPISVSQYGSAATIVTHDWVSPPTYSLLTFNCMNWVVKVANAAGVLLPNSQDEAGVSDPGTFGASLANIGNGNSSNGGLVTANASPDPPTPFDYSYAGLETAGHANPSGLATSIGLAYDPVNLGTVNANSTNGLVLTLAGINTNQSLISMSWGDGSPFQEQTLNFSHLYAAGTYQANLLVIDAGAVHSYSITVVVSPSPAVSVPVTVTPFPFANIPNQGFVSADPVPGFNVVQTTSIAILPNHHAVINSLGIPLWTYTIEATSDLNQGFLPVGSATAGADGTFQYNDSSATNFNSRFYRAKYP